MIVYLDTSAFVPLLVREAGTQRCLRLWAEAEQIVATRLVRVEAAAALAQARRLGRMTEAQLHEALGGLATLWAEIAVRELDRSLMLAASDAALRFGLRGYDAVHCAAAAEKLDGEAVAASGDRKLLAAWRALGLVTFDPVSS